jgi:hypothetical protein
MAFAAPQQFTAAHLDSLLDVFQQTQQAGSQSAAAKFLAQCPSIPGFVSLCMVSFASYSLLLYLRRTYRQLSRAGHRRAPRQIRLCYTLYGSDLLEKLGQK